MDDIKELYHLFPDLKENIVIEKKVGQGTFSYVYVGHYCRNKNENIALKYIIPTSSPSRTKQEIDCLLNIGGKDNVVGVLSILRNKSHVLILMPYIDHIAFHDSFINWNLNECKEYIKNLIIALNRVHQCGIIHRDVKPSNFLYDRQRKKFSLVDFGLAQTYDRKVENIFEYESTSIKRANSFKLDKTPIKHNFISLNNKKHLSNTPNQNKKMDSVINQTPSKDDKKGNSYESENQINDKDLKLKNSNNSSSPFTIINHSNENHKHTTNTPTNKSQLTNLQKYYSFQKSSYSISENKCTCFNMPFVCEICTMRANKWAPRAGTAGFRAPEVLFRSTHQTPSVDIWSAGIIFLSILTGRYPFFKAIDDHMAIMQMISVFGAEPVKKAALKYGESLVCSYDKDPTNLKALCVSLRKESINSYYSQLNKNKFQSEKTETIIEFPDTAYDLLKKLLDLDSDKRLTAEEALKHDFFKA